MGQDDDTIRPSDRRSHPRADVLLKVQYSTRDGFLQDYTTNLSRGGAMIHSSKPLTIGERVELRISFPGLLAPIPLVGVVRWVEKDEAEHAAGVEFCDWDERAETALHDLVERIVAGDRRVVAASRIRVLIVEDNPHVAGLIARGLESYQRRSTDSTAIETQHAADGHEALQVLEQQSFDLLIVDIFLPVLDGDALIRRLRADPRWATLPVIAVSAADEDVRDKVLDAGADFFLCKPIRLADVIATMRKLLHGDDASAPTGGEPTS